MIILTIRTDKPEAELGLYNGSERMAYVNWQAHKQLAETIHLKIKDLLGQNQIDLKDLQAIAAYSGPGSFTGLRIGLSVANALASSLNIPIVAASGDSWQKEAVKMLQGGVDQKMVVPNYGSPPHITQQKR